MSIWGELRRRKVVRVAGGYAIIGWLSLQLTSVLASLLDLPDWIGRMVVLIVVIGFPVSMVLAWAFDVTPGGIVRDRHKAKSRFGFKVEYILLAVVLVLSGWLLYLLDFGRTASDQPVALTAPVDESTQESAGDSLRKSVAILPFENLSPDPDNAYFAAGLHEEILHQLARIHDLRVISRKSVLQFVESNIGIPEIAAALNVQFVMEGSARYSGNEVRIQAQLIDGQTDENLWVNAYQRELTEIFSIQADIAQRIAAKLEASFLPQDKGRIESQSSQSPQALASYFQAISLDWGAAGDKDRALALLDDAISNDPDFGPAIAFRALVNATSLNNTPGSVEDWSAQSVRIEQTARLDAERALELDPLNPMFQAQYAVVLTSMGRLDEAIEVHRNVLRTVPNHPVALSELEVLLYAKGMYEEALEYGKAAAALIQLRVVEEAMGKGAPGVSLVHCAATGIHRPIGSLTGRHFDWTFSLNVRAFLELVQALMPRMAEGSSIVAISSEGAARAVGA